MKTKSLAFLIALLLFSVGLTAYAQDEQPLGPDAAVYGGDVIDLTAANDPNAPTAPFTCGDVGYSHAQTTTNPAWIDIAAEAGSTYAIGIDGREYGYSVDPFMTLYAPDGTTVLAYSNNYDGEDPLIHYTFTTPGVYKLKMEDIDGVGGRGPFYVWVDRPLYVSMAAAGTINGSSYAPSDVLRYFQCRTTNNWRMFFRPSNIGLNGNISGFAIEYDFYGAPSFLMSFAKKTNVPGLGSVPPQDIVRYYYPADLGGDTAGGFFTRAFDGSDVGLTQPGEAIDAIAIGELGNLLISITGAGAVPGVNGIADEDVLRFRARSYGNATQGVWDRYIDGSDIGLGPVDVIGLYKNGVTKEFHFSFDLAIAGSGANAALGDVAVCDVGQTGNNTTCNAWYNPPSFPTFDASAAGLTGKVDAIEVSGAMAYLRTE